MGEGGGTYEISTCHHIVAVQTIGPVATPRKKTVRKDPRLEDPIVTDLNTNCLEDTIHSTFVLFL
jgi:hypothetical protein